MITIIQGMTPAQFISALNDNFAEIATANDIYINSFVTITSSMTPEEQLQAINHNIRATAMSFGIRGNSFIQNLNTYFATPFHRFMDRHVIPIMLGAEPSPIVSEDGNTLDVFTTWARISTTDCINFTEPIGLIIDPSIGDSGLARVLRVGSTYYMVRSLYDLEHGGYYKLVLLTTTNKTNWTYVCDLIAPGNYSVNWNLTGACNSFMWNEDENWYIIYEGITDGAWPYKIGLATAPAITGPWTNHANNPIIPVDGSIEGDGRPVIATGVDNQVVKVNGKYFMYYHHDNTRTTMSLRRAYSTDLINWTVEGNIVDFRARPEAEGASNGDIGMCQFKGKSYLFYSNNANVNNDPPTKLGMGEDNRTMAEILALYP